jgi:tRNA-dihydrouridine synthase 1
MVRTASAGLKLPLFVKIRLLDTVQDTIELCQQLVQAGAALIAVHGRWVAAWWCSCDDPLHLSPCLVSACLPACSCLM